MLSADNEVEISDIKTPRACAIFIGVSMCSCLDLYLLDLTNYLVVVDIELPHRRRHNGLNANIDHSTKFSQ